MICVDLVYYLALAAMYSSIKHFRHFVEASVVTIFTDHKPLVSAFAKSNDSDWSPRQQRYFSFIAEFTTDIRHVSGCDNVVADALSHIALDCDAVDFTAMASAQLQDDDLRRFLSLSHDRTGLDLVNTNKYKLYCDVAHAKYRPFVPKIFRRQVFDQLHDLAHLVWLRPYVSSVIALFGQGCARTFDSGVAPAFLVSVPKSVNILIHLLVIFQSMNDFTPCTWTWSVRWLRPLVSRICSHAWTAFPDGRKQFHFPTLPPTQLLQLFSTFGLRVSGFLLSSFLIVGDSSFLTYGLP